MTAFPFPIAGECRCPDLVAATAHYPGCIIGALVGLEAPCDPRDSTSPPTPTEQPSGPGAPPPAVDLMAALEASLAEVRDRRTSAAWRAG